MQLHAGPPGDMTESSLAGLRDEPVQCSFFLWTAVALRLRFIVRERKKRVVEEREDTTSATMTRCSVVWLNQTAVDPWLACSHCWLWRAILNPILRTSTEGSSLPAPTMRTPTSMEIRVVLAWS